MLDPAAFALLSTARKVSRRETLPLKFVFLPPESLITLHKYCNMLAFLDRCLGQLWGLWGELVSAHACRPAHTQFTATFLTQTSCSSSTQLQRHRVREERHGLQP